MIRGRVGVEVCEVIDLSVDICGIYQEGCQSSQRGSESRVEWSYVRACDKAGRQSVHKEFNLFLLSNVTNLFLFLLVLFLVYFSASLPAHPPLYLPVSMLNTS